MIGIMKRKSRRASYAEYIKMRRLYEEGYGINKIAKELGRSENAIRRWLKKKPSHIKIIEETRKKMEKEAATIEKKEMCLALIAGLIDSDGLIRLRSRVKCIEVKTSTDEVYLYAYRIKKVLQACSRYTNIGSFRVTAKPAGGERWRIYIFFEDDADLERLHQYITDSTFRRKIENNFILLKYYLLAYIDGDGTYDKTGVKISIGGDKEKERMKTLLYKLGIQHVYERLKYKKGEKLRIEDRIVTVRKNNYDLWINKTEYKYRIGTSIKELKKTKPSLNRPEMLDR